MSEQTQSFSVRAIPPSGLQRRFRAGRSWEKSPTIVKVVENPAPPRVDRDRDGREFKTYSDEISASDLEALRADPHFAVSPAGGADAASLELNALKAKAAELDAEVTAARREIAGLKEDQLAMRATSSKEAETKAAEIMKLEQDLKDARGQLAKRRSV